MAAETSFNVLMHGLTPEHHLLSEEEAEEVLSKLGINRGQLPKIRKSDPAIKILENINGKPIDEGSVIRVVRSSETALEFTVYRLVTRG